MRRENPDPTPAGLQSRAALRRRRFGVALANLALYAALLVWLAAILGSGGWSLLRVGIFIAFAVAAPWSVLGRLQFLARLLAAACSRRRARTGGAVRFAIGGGAAKIADRHPDDPAQ